ncbi:MAG: putative glycoside hydrolase, partial [candidate division WOR-3 bacterium]
MNCTLLLLLSNILVYPQPPSNYLPKGSKNYLVNYSAIKRDLFRIDFAARQFVMIDEQNSPEGRQIKAINPNISILKYHCLVSAYPWNVYYNTILNPDDRCFMHSYDPAALFISRQGTKTKISWANDRRYSQLLGYRIRVANDTNGLGNLLIDTILKGRSVTIDSLLADSIFLHISTVKDSITEAWYSLATRINNSSLLTRHHYIDSIYSATYASYRDTLRDTLFLRVRVDSTITPDSVLIQIDLNHNRNPGEPNERFPLTYNPPFWTFFSSWDRNGYKAGTGFRILIKFGGMIDTIPSGGYLLTTNVNNRLRSNPYGNELMNPCNPTWQNYSLDRINENLLGPDYSGVFCDNTTHKIQTWMYEVPKVYCYDDTTWKYGMIQFLGRVDSVAGSNPVFFNGLGMTGSEVLLPSADGGMFEGLYCSNWGGYASESWWQSSQNQVLKTRYTYHKIFLGLPQAPITDTLGRMFVYGSFLLTCDDSVWFANANSYSIFAHFPEMNLVLGKPLDTAYTNINELRHPNGYYVRPFEHGVVLVNPTSNPIILSGSYPNNLVVVSPATTIAGGKIYTVPFTDQQINAKNALILLNEPLSPPQIHNVEFNPPRPTDGNQNLIMAKVTGSQPLYVEACLEKILGPMHLIMNDSGFNGDTLAGDSVFTATFYLPVGVPAREDTIRVLAYDTTGMVAVFPRTVRPAPTDSLNWLVNWSFEYDINNDNIPDFWRSYANGFLYDTSGLNAVSGSRSVHIIANTPDSSYGIY